MSEATEKTRYAPRFERVETPMPFRITERDLEILRWLSRCRYLRTGQVHRLVFAENATDQSARRRLKLLYHGGFIGRIEPKTTIGHGSAEIAYCLEKSGAEVLAGMGETPRVYGKAGKVGPLFLEHALDVSEFRVMTELALRDHPAVALARFVADFEIKSEAKPGTGKERYALYSAMAEPLTGRTLEVYPDALVILRGTGEFAEHQELFMVEIDRGTEDLTRIQDKVRGYHQFAKERAFQKFGRFTDFLVLMQTSSRRRAGNMRDALQGLAGTERIWITSVDQVAPATVLASPIWRDHENKARQVLRG